MFCLFLLHKYNAEIKSGFHSMIESFNSAGKGDPDHIYNDITKTDYVGGLGSTTDSNVKSYTKEVPVEPTTIGPKISIDGIIYYTNIERKKIGLKPLVKSTKLNTSAGVKTDDMFSQQYFEHTSPDGKTAADLVRDAGYKFQIVGENLALGVFDSDKALVKAWMDSPAHRANILNPKYTEMGASVGIAEYHGQRQWIAVQHFAKPMPNCPEINQSIQKNIDVEKTALEVEERELQKIAAAIEERGPDNSDQQYIKAYNDRVSAYNERLNTLRETIAVFNSTIVEYNTCVKG